MSAFDNTANKKTSNKSKSVKAANNAVLPPISPPKTEEVEKIFVSDTEAHDAEVPLTVETDADAGNATAKKPRVKKTIPVKYMRIVSFTFSVLANISSISPDQAYDVLVDTFGLDSDVDSVIKAVDDRLNDDEMLENTKTFLKIKKAERVKAAKDAVKLANKEAAKAERAASRAAAKAASLTESLLEKADQIDDVVVSQKKERAPRKVKKEADVQVPPPLTQTLLNAGFTEDQLMGSPVKTSKQNSPANIIKEARELAEKALENTVSIDSEQVAPEPKTPVKRTKKVVVPPIQTENLTIEEPSVFQPTSLKEQSEKLADQKSVAKNLQANRATTAKKGKRPATAAAVATPELAADQEM